MPFPNTQADHTIRGIFGIMILDLRLDHLGIPRAIYRRRMYPHSTMTVTVLFYRRNARIWVFLLAILVNKCLLFPLFISIGKTLLINDWNYASNSITCHDELHHWFIFSLALTRVCLHNQAIFMLGLWDRLHFAFALQVWFVVITYLVL